MSLSNTSYLLGCHRGGRVDLPPAAQRETVARHTPHPLTNWLADIRGEQHDLTFSGTCTRHVYNQSEGTGVNGEATRRLGGSSVVATTSPCSCYVSCQKSTMRLSGSYEGRVVQALYLATKCFSYEQPGHEVDVWMYSLRQDYCLLRQPQCLIIVALWGTVSQVCQLCWSECRYLLLLLLIVRSTV